MGKTKCLTNNNGKTNHYEIDILEMMIENKDSNDKPGKCALYKHCSNIIMCNMPLNEFDSDVCV